MAAPLEIRSNGRRWRLQAQPTTNHSIKLIVVEGVHRVELIVHERYRQRIIDHINAAFVSAGSAASLTQRPDAD